ncbi:hypothetical protein [Flavobacterium sp.]|uniref:hypothetical protein n=1 Tax=Flavobacterium sp. TaxID=239 RepID=UPI0039E2606A
MRNESQDSIGKIIADSLGINKNFYKADFDNNGYTDLLIIGDNHTCWGTNGSCDFSSFVLMNFEKDSINAIDIKNNHHSFIVPRIIYENKQPFLEINIPAILHWRTKKERRKPRT